MFDPMCFMDGFVNAFKGASVGAVTDTIMIDIVHSGHAFTDAGLGVATGATIFETMWYRNCIIYVEDHRQMNGMESKLDES